MAGFLMMSGRGAPAHRRAMDVGALPRCAGLCPVTVSSSSRGKIHRPDDGEENAPEIAPFGIANEARLGPRFPHSHDRGPRG